MRHLRLLCITFGVLLLGACEASRAHVVVEVSLTGLDGNAVPLADVPVTAYAEDPAAAATPPEPIKADTTDRNGIVWLRGLELGRIWVQASYEVPEDKVLHWNVPVEVTQGQPQVVLNRANATVRPK